MSTDEHDPDVTNRTRRRAMKLSGLAAVGSLAALAGCGDDSPEEQEPDDEDAVAPEGDDPEDDPTEEETVDDDENANGGLEDGED